ncbi:GNAT family N-acetyltransferase [Brevundimonas sp.]|uniref:GNAT family N-acetyltransferase n=1 Tax=Brevundimonas sp. TaxID=1871086 RepID=UPI00289F5FB0|nr:GNAT family N-acetyltransferase [Brevundimonas sp.]
MTQHQDRIVAFAPTHREAWKRLNTDWLIDGGFALEAKDHLTLDDPVGQILSRGGHIFFAERDAVPVGCCGLIAMADGGFEVTKMTVRPEARGGGLALRLLEACEAAARDAGAHRLYLETSSTLGPALSLYARFGFVTLAPQPTPYARCDVWMEKRL